MTSRVLVLAALLAPAIAHAGPTVPATFEVIDRGDAVEVVAHNVKATHTAINPVRSRLEVSVASIPYTAAIAPKDVTVREVEFENQSLSVKLNYERNDVKTLAKYAQAIQVGDDLHLLVPRKVPAEGQTVKLPEPTLPPAIAAKLAEAQQAATKAESTPAAKPAIAKTETPSVEPTADAKPEIKSEIKPEAKVEPKPEPKAKKAIPTVSDDDATSKLSMYIAAGLGAIGLGVWLLKRKKGVTATPSTIDVIAQRSLGGKAKVMWIAAGSREMIVAVTPQSVRMLAQWKRAINGGEEIAMPLPAAQQMERTDSGRLASVGPFPRAATSPAVSGLIRLRAQTQNIVNQDVATDDVEADSQWAKDLLAATGGRR